MSRPSRNESSKAPPRSIRFAARGHANISATHAASFEFVADPEVTQSGTCIIGVAAEGDMAGLLALRGPVGITIRCGDVVERVRATMNPYHILGDPLIVRTNPEAQHRSLCIGADKGAAALDRALVAALRAPDATIEVVIEELTRDARGPGVLFVVGTPIGNRLDLSPRAEATLRSADLILAEDTRTTRQLLGRDCPPLLSLHDHNERERMPEVLGHLDRGMRVALVSEAGMPLVSDPGYRVVNEAVAHGHLIVPLPGPDAVTAALSVSGLPVNDFRFLGFLPRKASERAERLREIIEVPYSSVFFEAPHRVIETLEAIAATLGPRQIAACRNLTKPGEEVLRGTASEVAHSLGERDVVRGEFTLVVAGGAPVAQSELSQELRRAAESLVGAGVPTKAIAAALAEATGMPRRDLFAAVLAMRDAD